MGSSVSMTQEGFDRLSLGPIEFGLPSPCLVPDVGIDESLLEYSGIDSNAVLQAYSNELLNSVPGYIASLGSALAPVTFNAVGLGALVISMIIEISMKSTTQTTDDSYSMLRRVFGEEKASDVRDTMSEYLKRHRMFKNNDQQLRQELHTIEAQLSKELTILRNSLLHDGQMNTRGFKIWVNGASFHLQMLIHEARLNVQTDKPASDYVNAINAAIDVYLQDLDHLLEKYKTHMTSTVMEPYQSKCVIISIATGRHLIGNDETVCSITQAHMYDGPCGESKEKEAYKNHVFTKYEPISGLKSHFSNIKNNLNSLINQRGSFTRPQISSAG